MWGTERLVFEHFLADKLTTMNFYKFNDQIKIKFKYEILKILVKKYGIFTIKKKNQVNSQKRLTH